MDIQTAYELVRDSFQMDNNACISLPVPVTWEGQWCHAFFTYGISYRNFLPYPASDCRIVMPDGRVEVSWTAFDIRSIKPDTRRDRRLDPEAWQEVYDTAYAAYDDAYEELRTQRIGENCRTYINAVRQATLPSQMAYYESMCPTLFAQS